MKINDEILSAFLDGELPEAQMRQVRERLAEDPALADRLAELSATDEALVHHYSAIDERPLPEGLQQLLADSDTRFESEPGPAKPSAQVIEFPLWRRARQALSQHAGLAASVALALGFGLAQLTGTFTGTIAPNTADSWQPVAQRLDTLPSGASQSLPDGREITPRISFVNQQGQYCRQYRLSGSEQSSENIACRTEQGSAAWEQMASISQPATESGSYQTASGGSVLDGVLDQMMADGIIEPSREQQLIQQNWQQSQ